MNRAWMWVIVVILILSVISIGILYERVRMLMVADMNEVTKNVDKVMLEMPDSEMDSIHVFDKMYSWKIFTTIDQHMETKTKVVRIELNRSWIFGNNVLTVTRSELNH